MNKLIELALKVIELIYIYITKFKYKGINIFTSLYNYYKIFIQLLDNLKISFEILVSFTLNIIYNKFIRNSNK